LLQAGQAFNANDNIADFIKIGELDELRAEEENKIAQLLSRH